MATCKTRDVVFTSYLGYDYSQTNDAHLGCNLANTPILSEIPSTPTASKGSYIFKNNGSTVLLNASGTDGDTSIVLSSCSSTSAPANVLLADKTGTYSKKFETVGNSKNAVLEGDSLKFSGVDYKALVDTHTLQIANLSAVDVTELAKLADLDAVDVVLKSRIKTIEDKQPIIINIPVHHVPSVFADSSGRADYIPATVSAVTPYSGLYYKNALNQKINWYIQPDTGLTIRDLKGLMLNFYNVSATSGLGCPFITCYTKIDTVTPNAASWYKSRKTFCVDYTSSIAISTSIALLADLKGLTYDPLAYGHSKVTATTIPGNDKGPFADDEQVLFFSIGTSSNSAAGLYEFIASKFTVLTAKASTEFSFIQL